MRNLKSMLPQRINITRKTFDIDSSFEEKPGEKTKTGCNELETNHDE